MKKLIFSITLCFVYSRSVIILTVALFVTNIITYLRVKNILQDNIDVMIYLLNNINLCQKVRNISDNDFSELREVIKKIKKCKDLNKIKRYSFSLSRNKDYSVLLVVDLFLQYIKMFFMAVRDNVMEGESYFISEKQFENITGFIKWKN